MRNANTEIKISDYERSAQWVTDARDALKQEIGESVSVEDVIRLLKEPEAQVNWSKIANKPKSSVRYVLALQAGLAHLFGIEGLGSHGIDGFYGNKTKSLVRKFQTSWNQQNPEDQIKVDEMIGTQTLPRFIKQLESSSRANVAEESASELETQPEITEEAETNAVSSDGDVVTNVEIPEQEQSEQNLIAGTETEKKEDLSLPETPKIPDTPNVQTVLPTLPEIEVPADSVTSPVLPVESNVTQALDVPEIPDLNFTESVTGAAEVIQ